jgi:hypothetical protein
MTLLDRPSVSKMAKKLTDDVNYRGFALFLGTVSLFFVLPVAETSLDMKQSSQRAACAVVERSITRIQSNITIETHTFAPDPIFNAFTFRARGRWLRRLQI